MGASGSLRRYNERSVRWGVFGDRDEVESPIRQMLNTERG